MAGKFYNDRKKIILVVCLAGCAVVSVFGSGEKLFWLYILIYTWSTIHLFSVVAGKFYYDRKKSSSRLSGGLCSCVSFWFWREIDFGCTYYYVLGVPYSCGVVLVILVLVGNSFWCYVRT